MSNIITFSDLVREAFIDPLRSVLIVDDQYPTWEEILNTAHNIESNKNDESDNKTIKEWVKQPENSLKVISQFRKRNPGFIIDIHDTLSHTRSNSSATTVNPEELANHLYQSDLLVLDYNLEGNNSGLRGEKARKILQSVLQNKHFNLIIIHTGEDSLDEVFFECLQSLTISFTSTLSDTCNEEIDTLDVKLDGLEIEEDFNKDEIKESFGIDEYLYFRQNEKKIPLMIREFMGSKGKFSNLSEIGKRIGLKNLELKNLLFLAVREFEKRLGLSNFTDQVFESLKWNNSSNCKWIRTIRGFVTFVSKGPEDLLGELQKALESWKPTPSRLLSAKYRHQLSSIGVEAEDRTLLKAHAYAHLYKEIKGTQSQNDNIDTLKKIRSTKLKEHVLRQSEAISFHIEDELVDFGEKIITADTDKSCLFSTHYGVNLDDPSEAKKAITQYNSYISTLPLKTGNDQLDSGHIFIMDNCWWVCATPACDLQPTQNTIAFIGQNKELRPFTALLLKKINLDDISSDHINSGSYCFIEEKPGEIIALGLRTVLEEGKPATEKVTWRIFLAKENGFVRDNKLGIFIPKLDDQGFKSMDYEATIVAKLRYEYALNYIKKVGTSVSRIGLGYASL